LKPDVCRRVVGRLPSPRSQGSLATGCAGQRRGMAPPFSLCCPPKKAEKFTVVYLVRSFRLLPESALSRLARSTELSKTESRSA